MHWGYFVRTYGFEFQIEKKKKSEFSHLGNKLNPIETSQTRSHVPSGRRLKIRIKQK